MCFMCMRDSTHFLRYLENAPIMPLGVFLVFKLCLILKLKLRHSVQRKSTDIILISLHKHMLRNTQKEPALLAQSDAR